MGVRLWSRRARAPAPAGIDPVQKPARDTAGLKPYMTLSERALWSRWASGPASVGIDLTEKPARDTLRLKLSATLPERAPVRFCKQEAA